MQLTDFYVRVYEQFGENLGNFYLQDTVLIALGSKTASYALEEGTDPKTVWLALCEEFDIPQKYR